MDLRLLEKFFDNRCRPDEVAEVLRWFDTSEDQAETLARLEEHWERHRPDEAPPHPSAHQALRNLHQKMDQPSTPTGSRLLPTVRRKRRKSRYLAVAAVVILAIVGTLTMRHYETSPSFPAIASWVKSTTSGQKQTFRLPDGTRVKLNSNSKLVYSTTEDQGPRKVSLIGEAFFEVAHDPQRPFTVTARGVSTTALGTSFNVQAYDTTVAVALVTGQVRVAQQQATAVLTPGELLRLSPRALPHRSRYDALRDLGWKEGTLYFSQATLPEVKQQLERWYGVAITAQGVPAQPWSYTGTFTGENLENVLTSISYTQGFTFTLQEKRVTIHFH